MVMEESFASESSSGAAAASLVLSRPPPPVRPNTFRWRSTGGYGRIPRLGEEDSAISSSCLPRDRRRIRRKSWPEAERSVGFNNKEDHGIFTSFPDCEGERDDLEDGLLQVYAQKLFIVPSFLIRLHFYTPQYSLPARKSAGVLKMNHR